MESGEFPYARFELRRVEYDVPRRALLSGGAFTAFEASGRDVHLRQRVVRRLPNRTLQHPLPILQDWKPDTEASVLTRTGTLGMEGDGPQVRYA
jgi:hypothetical protein